MKKNIFCNHICTLIMLFASLCAISLQAETKRDTVQPVPFVQQAPAANRDHQEVVVLKAQLATMQVFTDRLIATVYWSLGSLVVVASLLIGFSWFNSLRLHERDIAAIRNELSNAVKSDFSNLRQEIETSTKDELNKIIATSSATAGKTAESLFKPIQATIQNHANSIKELQKDLAYTTFKSEAWYWEILKVPANEFALHSEILRLAIKEKDSFQISESLQKLRELLNLDIRLMAPDITEIIALIDKLPAEYAIHVEALRSGFRTVKTL